MSGLAQPRPQGHDLHTEQRRSRTLAAQGANRGRCTRPHDRGRDLGTFRLAAGNELVIVGSVRGCSSSGARLVTWDDVRAVTCRRRLSAHRTRDHGRSPGPDSANEHLPTLSPPHAVTLTCTDLDTMAPVSAPDPKAEWWSSSDVAAYLGVRLGTVSTYRARGQMPTPDLTIGSRTHLWKPATIIQWHEARPRPGTGGRPMHRSKQEG